MTHAEHDAERGSAKVFGEVIKPPVLIDDVKPSRQRAHHLLNSFRPSSQALSAGGDFRYYVDSSGCQHFNFEQRIWRNPSVQMAVTPVMTTALETLAINLLAYITRERGDSASVRVTSKGLVRLARRFCAECLLTACPAGWVIPRCTIEAWLVSQRRLRVPATSKFRAGKRRQGAVTRDKKPSNSHTKVNSNMRRPKAAP